ncbi:protein of unknown function DUF1152 [Ferroglobus placidus DSM 10642]|uniref:DUF1152 domain-containing protein n=1 Tax=Ferroglobus placidus (strain DSM 10642 / AEDII12DO) TaxID=589924 RepID=D3S1K1_FERPA|nr:DUF1152 domain-containing protein [Ferroglobus placidus]ADC66465.1 protein of unknown function DUF1152 [Ferroglobus placidus DSM 10642]
MKNFIEKFRIECVLGGVVWERIRRDKKPGPAALEEIVGVERINECLGWLKGGETVNGVELICSKVAGFLGEKVLALDITKGAENLRKSLTEFLEEREFDLIFAVDAGGDSIARGSEKNLTSPLADSVAIASLRDFGTILAIVGFGSDGELSRYEIERYLSEDHDAILGVSLVEWEEKLENFVFSVETESSKIPLLASKGYFGKYKFWGEFDMDVSILNALVFYLDLRKIYGKLLAKNVENTFSIFEANEKLHEIGIKTELDLEIEIAKREGLL